MIEKFNHHLPLKDEDFNHLFNEGYFVLDTNVLINFYRYSDNTRNQFFDILDKIKDRIYLPYQVGNEFFNNRLNEIGTQKNSYKEMVDKIINIKQEFENKNRNPFLSSGNLVLFDKIIDELKNKEEEYRELRRDDIILSRLNSIFQNSGDEFYDYEKIFSEGRKRFKDKIPPGYKDDDKPIEIQKFGDYIIWVDIMKKSQEENKPCIFITDDNKEDWWLLDKNKNIVSPRPELRKEFQKNTGQLYYSYQPFNFLDTIQKYINVEVEESVIDEVKNNSLENDSETSIIFIDKFVLAKEDANFMYFIKTISDMGYQTEINHLSHTDEGFLYRITIMLPEIFDLGRRFSTYFKNLANTHAIRVLSNEEVEYYLTKKGKV